MKLRGLLVAVVILLALSGVLYWSNHRKLDDSAAKTSPDVSPKILDLKSDDISKIEIARAGQPTVLLDKTDGSWKLTQPAPLPADSQAASSLASAFAPLIGERVIEEKAADLSPFGLSSPSAQISVTTKDNKSSQLQIGNASPTGNSWYVKLAADPRVFTISNYNKSSMDKTAADLRDKRLLTLDFDKASQIEVAGEKQSITFARSKDEWQILKPKPWRADQLAVSDLVQALRDAKLDPATDQKDAAAQFNSGKLAASAKVFAPSGTQTLQIRKNKENYFAKSSAVEGIYKVPQNISEALNKKLEDFRDKKLFSFGYESPDKIEIHDGTKAYFLTHANGDWWGADGKKLEANSAETLVDKLRDLSADKFPDSGFTSPSVEIVVTSKGGKSIEKIQIARVSGKSGDTYIAKRDGEPALYGLEPVLVTGLQQAAADLKPAPPPAPIPEKKK